MAENLLPQAPPSFGGFSVDEITLFLAEKMAEGYNLLVKVRL